MKCLILNIPGSLTDTVKDSYILIDISSIATLCCFDAIGWMT